MGFDAASAVEPLDFDFHPYADAKGTVPEPSQEQVERLFEAIRGLAVAAGIQPGASREEAIAAFAAIPEEVQKEQARHTLDALVEFCQGSPSREQIEQLPYRPLNAFIGWLVGHFAGDAGKGVTEPSPARANGGVPHI